jgi:AcrR family transcriptional regulator
MPKASEPEGTEGAAAAGGASGAEPPLAASLEAAWGRRARPTKGPKPALSLERIVEAAVALAQAEGIGAVSMARVAGELGSSPMSLYRYVAAKDELLALMVDAALGPVPQPAEGEDWRAGLTRWAWGYHDAFRRHPWALYVPSGPAVTPNLTAWLEDGLQSLAATGLPEAQKLSVLLLVSGYVRNEATLAATIGATEGGEIMPTWGRQLARLTDPEDFPALHRALGSEAFAQDDAPDEEFVFGLERVLDGIGSLVSGKDAPRRCER